MVFYSTDGMGRDGYITYNDGGFWKDNIKNITLKPDYPRHKYTIYHSLNHQPAPFNYQSDGNGRDSYVIENNGGLVKEFQPLIKQKLIKFLRKEDEQIKRKTFLSKSQKNYLNKIKKIQKNVVNRLYNKSMEKIKNNRKRLYYKSSSAYFNDNIIKKNFESISPIKSYNNKGKFYNKNIKNNKFINPMKNNGQKSLFDRILKNRNIHENNSMKNMEYFQKRDNTDKVKVLKNLKMNYNDYDSFKNNTTIYNNENKNKYNKIFFNNYNLKNKNYNVAVGPDDLNKNNNLFHNIKNIPNNVNNVNNLYNDKNINDHSDIKDYDNNNTLFKKKFEDKEGINNKMNNTDYLVNFNRTQIFSKNKPFLVDDHNDYRENYNKYIKSKKYII